MKKEKSSSRQSKPERPEGKTVLVPLLSKKEADSRFIERAAENASEIVLLLVIDTNAMAGKFGFATNEIAVGNQLMEEAKTAFGKKRKTCRDVIEWGDTANKIAHMAQLYRIGKICIVKQNNDYYSKLVKNLKETLEGTEIEEIEVLQQKGA